MTRVKILKFNNFTEENYKRFRELISEDKRTRIDRFKHVEDYRRSLLGDVLARKMLEKMTGIGAKDLDIRIDDNGKPFVNNSENAYFNVSHSGEYVACIVSDKPCGIDIESMDKDNLDIARRFFAKSEYEYIIDCPPEQKRERFFEIWTAKEAYSKLEGIGLGIGLDSFEIVNKEGRYVVLVNGIEKNTVTVNNIEGRYILSHIEGDDSKVCVETESGELYAI